MAEERRAASDLQAKLRDGQFVVTAEITPPVSTDPSEFLQRALPLRGLATAVNVTDGAGADFAQTQFCMDIEVVRRYAARLVECGVAPRLPILIGISPIPSARSARWMREKLFGSIIPERIVQRLEGAADAKREGAKICV